jgi:nitrate/TMAO reductase-like tetraheme cytochrome c subunit
MSDGTPAGVPPPRRLGRGALVLLAVAAALVIAGAGGVGLWHVSASPRFCNSCHLMRPYVEAWRVSKHGAIPCVECHYPPGLRDTLRVKFQAVTQVAKWATGTYSSKPFAEVEDASCLRSGCHARRALEHEGVRTFARGIRFEHGPHLDAAKTVWQLRCTSCHAQIVVNKHFEVEQSTCFTCHFKGTKGDRELVPVAGCTSCHVPPAGEIAVGSVRFDHGELARRGVACQSCHLNVVDGRGDAPRERCVTCHNQPEKLAADGDRARIHAAHVTARSITCVRCHDEIRHRLPPPIGAPTARAPDLPAASVALRDAP